MIAGNADEDKAGDREDKVSYLTIECTVTIHPEQGRDTNHLQVNPVPQTP